MLKDILSEFLNCLYIFTLNINLKYYAKKINIIKLKELYHSFIKFID